MKVHELISILEDCDERAEVRYVESGEIRISEKDCGCTIDEACEIKVIGENGKVVYLH